MQANMRNGKLPIAFTLIELPVRRGKRRGFTLIELLVVVTIIVVLLALLVPAMDRAIASAESAVCMTNLRNWSMALHRYSLDNKGQTPNISENGPRTYWWAYLSQYVGEGDYPTRSPLGWVKAGVCPSGDVKPGEGTDVPQTLALAQKWGKWGSANKAWEWGLLNENTEATDASYGMNLWLAPTGLQSQGYPRDYFWGRYTRVPGDAPAFGDGIWIGGWPLDSDLPPSSSEYGNGDAGWTTGGMMGRWVINRHPLSNQAMNMAFVDGTVRNVRLGGLWNLRWHGQFIPSTAYEQEYP